MNNRKFFFIFLTNTRSLVGLVRDFLITFDSAHYRSKNSSLTSRFLPRFHFLFVGQRNLFEPSPYFLPAEYVNMAPRTVAKNRFSFLHYLYHGSGYSPSTSWDRRYLYFAPEAIDYERSLLAHAFRYHKDDFNIILQNNFITNRNESLFLSKKDLIFMHETSAKAFWEINSCKKVTIHIDYCAELAFLPTEKSLDDIRIFTVRKEHSHEQASHLVELKIKMDGPTSVLISAHRPCFIPTTQIARILSLSISENEKIELIHSMLNDLNSRQKYISKLSSQVPQSFSVPRSDTSVFSKEPNEIVNVRLKSQTLKPRNFGRILLVSHEDSWSGAPIYLNQLALELLEKGFEVHVLSLRGELRKGVFSGLRSKHSYLNEYRSKRNRNSSVIRNWLLTVVGEEAVDQVMDKFKPDLVIANSLCSSDFIRLSVAHKIPSLLYVHEAWAFERNDLNSKPNFQSRCKESLEACNYAVFGSQATYDHWHSSGLAINGVVIPTLRQLSVPIKSSRLSLRKSMRKRLRIEKGTIVFLSVASFEPRKRINDIVSAFIAMNDLKTCLILVGADPLRVDHDFNKLVKERSNILVVNSTKNLEPYYAAADSLVFASEEETMPLVLQEATFWNLPRICSRYPGYRELIPSDDCAHLFDVGDIYTLQRKMRQVVEEPLQSIDIATRALKAQEALNKSSLDLLKKTIEKLHLIRTSVHPRSWLHDQS